MTIKTIDEIEQGDMIVIQTGKETIAIYTVDEIILEENLIIFKETFMDYSPDRDIVVLDEDYWG